MSHYLYLQCASHEPPITDHMEVALRLSQLDLVIESLVHRNVHKERFALLIDAMDHDYSAVAISMGRIEARVGQFITQHPNCKINIIDEYDKLQYVEEETFTNNSIAYLGDNGEARTIGEAGTTP